MSMDRQGTFAALEVRLDPELPRGVFQLRDGFGSVLWEWDEREEAAVNEEIREDVSLAGSDVKVPAEVEARLGHGMNVIRCRLPYGPDALLIDGQQVPLALSLAVVNHSPTGFSWGYGGSGPAQTALAILLHITGDAELSERLHQAFKNEHVATWPQEDTVASVDVAAWINARQGGRG